MDDSLFSDEEYQVLILALIEGQGARGATTQQIRDFLRWCREAVVNAALVDLIISGHTGVGINDKGEYIFSTKGVIS